jgi:hypothetical protein
MINLTKPRESISANSAAVMAEQWEQQFAATTVPNEQCNNLLLLLE